jgi:hypothetical protein
MSSGGEAPAASIPLLLVSARDRRRADLAARGRNAHDAGVDRDLMRRGLIEGDRSYYWPQMGDLRGESDRPAGRNTGKSLCFGGRASWGQRDGRH